MSRLIALASLTVRPGGSYPEAGCNADRTQDCRDIDSDWIDSDSLDFSGNRASILRDFQDWKAQRESVGHFQTRPESSFGGLEHNQ